MQLVEAGVGGRYEGWSLGTATVMELRTRDLGETAVGYHVTGAGHPVVLLHGLGESGSGWRSVLPVPASVARANGRCRLPWSEAAVPA